MNGRQLRRIRRGLGMTQVQMGAALAVTPNTVARWERDERRITPPMERLIRTHAEGNRGKMIRPFAAVAVGHTVLIGRQTDLFVNPVPADARPLGDALELDTFDSIEEARGWGLARGAEVLDARPRTDAAKR